MTTAVVRAALDAIEHSGPADWAWWLAQLVTGALVTGAVLIASWHGGAAVGEWLGRRGT